MRSFFIGLLILFFIVFALCARWYFVCKIRNHCGEKPTRAMTLSLKDGNQTILQGYEQFEFPEGSFRPNNTANNLLFLQKVADYLKENPEHHITLTGRYLTKEQNAKSGIYENVGIARAKVIEQMLEDLGIDEDRITIDHEMVNAESIDEPITFALYLPQPDVDEYAKLDISFTDNTFSDANFDFGSADFRPGEQCILYADSVKTFLSE